MRPPIAYQADNLIRAALHLSDQIREALSAGCDQEAGDIGEVLGKVNARLTRLGHEAVKP